MTASQQRLHLCALTLLAMLVVAMIAGCSAGSAPQNSSGASGNRAAGSSAETSQASSSNPNDPNAAYGMKVKELVKQFGPPAIENSAKNSGVSYVKGLAYADLVDFGDGNPRLVVCYLNPSKVKDSSMPGAFPQDYQVEVWQYANQKLECIPCGTAQLDGQNYYCNVIMYNTADGKPYIVTQEGSYGGPEGNVTHRAYGLDESNRFGLTTEVNNVYKGTDRTYTFNGKLVSADEGSAIIDKYFNYKNKTSIGLSSLMYNGSAPTSLVERTNSVISKLEADAA